MRENIHLKVQEEPSIKLKVSGDDRISIRPEELRVIEAVSPTVDIERDENSVIITVHDLNGTKSERIYDGEPGDPKELIDDTAGIGETDFTWSADKLTREIGAKITEPANDGTDKQVLTTDGSGGRYWSTVQSGDSSLPAGGIIGDLLCKSSNADYAVEWITPASSAEQDNTRPITAAAVYTEIGNINALLATI